MINKKNHLGYKPELLGIKDAVHIAIVSLRAGKPLKRAGYFKMNENGEAIPSSKKESIGVVDPFLEDNICTGDNFWGVINMYDIPNVRHDWTHPTQSFEAPTIPVRHNQRLENIAKSLGVTYESLMKACKQMAFEREPVVYNGTLSKEELDDKMNEIYKWDLFSEWSEETGYEFENIGTDCCPEYHYPEGHIYRFEK